jgi:hypothetical protein
MLDLMQPPFQKLIRRLLKQQQWQHVTQKLRFSDPLTLIVFAHDLLKRKK